MQKNYFGFKEVRIQRIHNSNAFPYSLSKKMSSGEREPAAGGEIVQVQGGIHRQRHRFRVHHSGDYKDLIRRLSYKLFARLRTVPVPGTDQDHTVKALVFNVYKQSLYLSFG